jgi:hypothetical protein
MFLKEKKGMGSGGFDYHRESILISGDYHSGPVQTIRVCGYVGLAILIIGMLRVAVHAHRQIERCRNTEWFSTALFIVAIYVWHTFSWVFIFGSFSGGADALLMGTALVRLLEKTLPLPEYEVKRREPYTLNSHRQRLAEANPPPRA